MFQHKVAHKCILYQATSGQRSCRGVLVSWGLVHNDGFGVWGLGFGAVSVVMQVLYRTAVVKTSTYIPTLSYGHDLRIATERSWIQVAGMRFLWRVHGLSLRDRVSSSDIWRDSLEGLLIPPGLGALQGFPGGAGKVLLVKKEALHTLVIPLSSQPNFK